MQSRRNFLMLSTGFGALALVGCATGTTTTTTVTNLVSAFQAIATMATGILPQIEAVANVPAATATQISTYITAIEQAVGAVGGSITQTQGQSVLNQIESAINAIAPLVLPFVSAIPGGSYIGLIVAALPALETAVGFLVSALTPAAVQVAQTAPPLPASATFGAINLPVSQQYLNLLISKAKASHRFHAH